MSGWTSTPKWRRSCDRKCVTAPALRCPPVDVLAHVVVLASLQYVTGVVIVSAAVLVLATAVLVPRRRVRQAKLIYDVPPRGQCHIIRTPSGPRLPARHALRQVRPPHRDNLWRRRHGKLLVDAGADLRRTESSWNSPPLSIAEYYGRFLPLQPIIEYLGSQEA